MLMNYKKTTLKVLSLGVVFSLCLRLKSASQKFTCFRKFLPCHFLFVGLFLYEVIKKHRLTEKMTFLFEFLQNCVIMNCTILYNNKTTGDVIMKMQKKILRKLITAVLSAFIVISIPTSVGWSAVNAAEALEESIYDTADYQSSGNGDREEEPNEEDGTLAVETEEPAAEASPISADSSYVSSSVTEVSKLLSIYANAEGGTEPYTYKYSYKLNDGAWNVISDFSSVKRKTIKVPDIGCSMKIRVTVKDSKKKISTKYMDVLVKKTIGTPFSDTGSFLSSKTAFVSGTVNVYAQFTGGTEPYQYKYSYRMGNGEWVGADKYLIKNIKTFKLPSVPGYCTVRIEAKDADGNTCTQTLPLTVCKDTNKSFKDLGSTLNASELWDKTTVTATAQFEGGVKPYSYKYSYRKNNGEWVVAKEYSTVKKLSVKLPGTGNYTVRVGAMDSAGNYTSKYLYVKVKHNTGKPLADDGSYVSKTYAAPGETITAFAKFAGGTEPYNYKYSYRYNNNSWVVVGDITSSNSKSIALPSQSGTYTVRIAAYDAVGTYQSKYITVYVGSSTGIKIYLSPSNQNGNLYAYGDTNEMEQCNRIADYTKIALERCGFAVKKAPANQEMAKSVAESNEWGADLHMPIHTNAGGGDGTMCMVYVKDEKSMKLARPIYEEVQAVSPGTYDYGIREYPDLYELKHTKGDAVYTEVDFHDNPKIAKWLIEHPADVGEAFARGVCRAYGVEYIPPSK